MPNNKKYSNKFDSDKQKGKSSAQDNCDDKTVDQHQKKVYDKKTPRKRESGQHARKNDWQFYAVSSEAAKRMASIPFYRVLGQKINLGENASTQNTIKTSGIVRIDYFPCLPQAKKSLTDKLAESDINRAVSAFYNYYTQGYSASVPFEATDLTLTMLSTAGLWMAMSHIKRAYGCARYYSAFNKYWARSVVEAMGFDFDDFNKNLAHIVTRYNQVARQINSSLVVPVGVKLLQRWIYLSSNVFMDGEDESNSPIWFYQATHWPSLESTRLNTGTAIIGRDPGLIHTTVDSYFEKIDLLLQELNTDDARAIFAALKRVYGDTNILQVDNLDFDYIVDFVHNDKDALNQFHNLQWIDDTPVGLFPSSLITDNPVTAAYTALNTGDQIIAYQQGTNIRSNICAKLNSYNRTNHGSINALIDFVDGDFSPERVLDATVDLVHLNDNIALSYGVQSSPATASTAYYVNARTEIPVRVRVYYIAASDSSETSSYIAVPNSFVWSAVTNDSAAICTITQFLYHPIVYLGGSGPFTPTGVIGTLYSYTTVTYDYITELHGITAYELLNVPQNTRDITK